MAPKRIILKSSSSGASVRGKGSPSNASEDEEINSGLEFEEDLEVDDGDELSDDQSDASVDGTVDRSLRMTARQRAMAEPTSEDDEANLKSLESTSHVPKRNVSEEEQLRRSEKTRRRNNQRDVKLEKARVDTIQRILQKQSARSKKIDEGNSSIEQSASLSWSDQPPLPGTIRFVSNADGSRLILPTTP